MTDSLAKSKRFSNTKDLQIMGCFRTLALAGFSLLMTPLLASVPADYPLAVHVDVKTLLESSYGKKAFLQFAPFFSGVNFFRDAIPSYDALPYPTEGEIGFTIAGHFDVGQQSRSSVVLISDYSVSTEQFGDYLQVVNAIGSNLYKGVVIHELGKSSGGKISNYMAQLEDGRMAVGSTLSDMRMVIQASLGERPSLDEKVDGFLEARDTSTLTVVVRNTPQLLEKFMMMAPYGTLSRGRNGGERMLSLLFSQESELAEEIREFDYLLLDFSMADDMKGSIKISFDSSDIAASAKGKLKDLMDYGFALARVRSPNNSTVLDWVEWGEMITFTQEGSVLHADFQMTADMIPTAEAKPLFTDRECVMNLVKLDGAKQQWALENLKDGDAVPTYDDLVGQSLYLRKTPVCPAGGVYTIGPVFEDPTCSIPGHEFPK